MNEREGKIVPPDAPASDAPSESAALIRMAWAEWELIQKKIDSVSTFPFTVKAWSVALAGLLLGLGKGFEFPKRLLFFTLLVPLIFKAVESTHNGIIETLSRRAERLEQLIERLRPLKKEKLPENFPGEWRDSLGRVPGVALSLIRASAKEKKQKVALKDPNGRWSWQWTGRNVNVLWQKYVARHSDVVFYAGQIFLMLVIMTGLTFCQRSQSGAKTTSDQGKPQATAIAIAEACSVGASNARQEEGRWLARERIHRERRLSRWRQYH